MTNIQQTILNCIYLRHHNGYVRQLVLERMINNENDYFVIPYIFQLLGEYVKEILEVIEKHITEKNINNYTKFIVENPKYFQQTESRMISYWNVYYRSSKYKKIDDYIGNKIFNRLKKAKIRS